MSNLLRSAALWTITAAKHKKSGFSPYGTFKTLTKLGSSNVFESIKSAANVFMKLRHRNHSRWQVPPSEPGFGLHVSCIFALLIFLASS